MECRASVPKTIGVLAFALVFGAVMYLLAVKVNGAASILGWFGVLVFAAVIVKFVGRLFRKDPSIIIDAEGIAASQLGAKRVPWSAVVAVSIRVENYQKVLCLWLRDEEQYVSNQSQMHRVFARANRAIGLPAITLHFAGLSPGVEEAYSYVKRFVPERAGA